VFELLSDAGTWTYKTLYSFCPERFCLDGSGPYGGLTYSGAISGEPYDGASPLFGITIFGGDGDFNQCDGDNGYGCGTVYELQHGQSGWSEQVLHSFCQQQDCPDGAAPWAPLLVDASGNIYGTTDSGGAHHGGILFKLVPGAGNWSESVVKSFCYGKCPNGTGPGSGGVAINPSGNLVGFLQGGGNRPPPHNACRIGGCGVAYSLSRADKRSGYKVLYAFCSLADCRDGGMPTSVWSADPPVVDSEGDIFGAAGVGGTTRECGTLFELNGSSLTVLYSFNDKNAVGCGPGHGLLRDQSGDLYGMTLYGGKNGSGAIFRYEP